MDNSENEHYVLPRLMRPEDRINLVEYLVEKRHSEVTIDCSVLEKLGALDLQVFLSAAKTWEADSCAFQLLNINEDVITNLSHFGCTDLHIIGAKTE